MAMSATHDGWTVEMLDALPNDGQRCELIDGVLHVMPAPGLVHQLIAGHLYHLLKLYLRGSMVARALISLSDVRRGNRTRNRVQPDAFVVGLVDGKLPPYPFAISHLLLAVEVNSQSDPLYDYQRWAANAIPKHREGSAMTVTCAAAVRSSTHRTYVALLMVTVGVASPGLGARGYVAARPERCASCYLRHRPLLARL
jgi:hypothetical protein